MFQLLEVDLATPDGPFTQEEIRDLESRGTELFGGKERAYVEIKPIKPKENKYLMQVFRR